MDPPCPHRQTTLRAAPADAESCPAQGWSCKLSVPAGLTPRTAHQPSQRCLQQAAWGDTLPANRTEAFTIENRNFYINGTWVGPAVARDCQVIDPSTEEVCAVISLGDQGDTDNAVAAAKAAFPAWAATPPATRRSLVAGILAQYEARVDEMARAISLEMGAPIDMSRDSQAPCVPWHLKNFLTAFDRIEWVRPLGPHAPDDRIALEPVWVVGLITPWNWPMNQVTLKVIPALLAGCTCVLKPSEESPLSSLLFAEFCHDAGLPPGVFNLVNGDGAGVGSQLSTHADVAMISFTGSTRAGRAISKAAADTLKRVTLELGGKGANLIFADADDRAVERGVRHMMNNSGQSCNAPSRMLVERSCYHRAVEIAAEVANAIKVGPASDRGHHIGPVVNKRQWEQIQGYIQKGIDEGARLVAGGPGLPEGMNRGFYVRPTVFADVTPGMTIEREEIFGPVLSILPFDTEADAVRLANDTPYGLTNYVQTQDGPRRNRLARALRSGMVELLNRGQSYYETASFKDKKLFLEFTLVFVALNLFLQIASAAVTRLPQFNLSPRLLANQTEGSICARCETRSPQSSLMQQLAQIQSVQTGTERIFNAATFVGNNPRSLIIDLRQRLANGETLSNEEMAVLRAAPQTGQISCQGNTGNNGTLIQINGRDAIITSAHGFIDPETGQPRCDLSTVGYFPNISFHNSDLGPPTDFEKRRVSTDGVPINLSNVSRPNYLNFENDYLIFFLSEQINSDQLDVTVNGQTQTTTRGYMKFDTGGSRSGPIYMIGLDKNVRNFTATNYQACNSRLTDQALFHSCDNVASTSSSALVRIVGDEALLTGINIGQFKDLSDVRELPKNDMIMIEGNIGLSIHEIPPETLGLSN